MPFGIWTAFCTEAAGAGRKNRKPFPHFKIFVCSSSFVQIHKTRACRGAQTALHEEPPM